MKEGDNMKRVFIVSPYRAETSAEIAQNIERAKAMCKKAIHEGCAPFAPHLLYPQFLDDAIPDEHNAGIICGLVWLDAADEVWYAAGVEISGRYSVDDSLTNLKINGVSTGISGSGFSSWCCVAQSCSLAKNSASRGSSEKVILGFGLLGW